MSFLPNGVPPAWGSVVGALSNQTDLQTALSGKVATNTLVFNAKDYGAVGNGSADDTAALLAWAAAVPIGGRGFLPSGTYRTTVTIPFGSQRIFYGGNANAGSIIKCMTSGMIGATYGSSSVVEDMQIDGNNLAAFGLKALAAINKPHLQRVRVVNCNEAHFLFDATQNAVILDCMAQNGSGHNYAFYNGCANMKLINCNGNYSSGSVAESRCIFFGMVDESVDTRFGPSTGVYAGIKVQGNRNDTFIGGIFERGNDAMTYGVEITGSVGGYIAFSDVELNAGSIACLLLNPASTGILYLNRVAFTLNGANIGAQALGGEIHVDDVQFSGRAGRDPRQLILATGGTGCVRWTNPNLVDLASSSFQQGVGRWVASGSGSISYDTTKHRIIGTSTGTTIGIRWTFSGSGVAVQYRLLRYRFVILNIVGGTNVRFNTINATTHVSQGSFGPGEWSGVIEMIGDEIGFSFSSDSTTSTTFELCSFALEIL